VLAFTSSGPSSVGALYSHFFSGESELGVGDAAGAGVSENADPKLESQSKIKTLAIAANFGLIDFRFIGCKTISSFFFDFFLCHPMRFDDLPVAARIAPYLLSAFSLATAIWYSSAVLSPVAMDFLKSSAALALSLLSNRFMPA
jgi:hypothetical protein